MAAHLGGLLSDEVDLHLYVAACDPAKQEFTTAQFWMRVLQNQFPIKDGYSLALGVPLVPEGTGQQVNMVVFALYNREMHPLLFVEWKRAAKDAPGGRDAAEKQVLGYCEQYFSRNPGHPFMHAMVCAGGRGRIWRVEPRTKPDTSLDGPDLYVDAKTDPSGVLARAFEAVRQSKPVSSCGKPPLYS